MIRHTLPRDISEVTHTPFCESVGEETTLSECKTLAEESLGAGTGGLVARANEEDRDVGEDGKVKIWLSPDSDTSERNPCMVGDPCSWLLGRERWDLKLAGVP